MTPYSLSFPALLAKKGAKIPRQAACRLSLRFSDFSIGYSPARQTVFERDGRRANILFYGTDTS
jgi:hypothetical protein